MALTKVAGFDGKDGEGDRIIVAHSTDERFGIDNGYGVWVQRENYSAGKMVKTWRYITTNQTKEQAIEKFNKLNKN